MGNSKGLQRFWSFLMGPFKKKNKKKNKSQDNLAKDNKQEKNQEFGELDLEAIGTSKPLPNINILKDKIVARPPRKQGLKVVGKAVVHEEKIDVEPNKLKNEELNKKDDNKSEEEKKIAKPKTPLKPPTKPFQTPSSPVNQTPIILSADNTAPQLCDNSIPPTTQETPLSQKAEDIKKTSIESTEIKEDSSKDTIGTQTSVGTNLTTPIVKKDDKEVALDDSGCDLNDSKKEESISSKDENAFENSKESEEKAKINSQEIIYNESVEIKENKDHNLLKEKSDLTIDQRLSEFDEVLDNAEKSLGDAVGDVFTDETPISTIDKKIVISTKKLSENGSSKDLIENKIKIESEMITKEDELTENMAAKDDNVELDSASISMKAAEDSFGLESTTTIKLEPSEKELVPIKNEIELKKEVDKIDNVETGETKIEFIEITSKVYDKNTDMDANLRSKSVIHDASETTLPSTRLTSMPITLNNESMNNEVFISDKSSPIDSNTNSFSSYECSTTKNDQVTDVTNSLNDEKINELNQSCSKVESEIEEKTEIVEVSFEVTDDIKERITEVDENVPSKLSEYKTKASEDVNENNEGEGVDDSVKRPQLGKFEFKSADRTSLLYQKDFIKTTSEKNALDDVNETINDDKDSEKDETTCNKVKSPVIPVKPAFIMKKAVSVVEEDKLTTLVDNTSSDRSKSTKNVELTHSVSESHESSKSQAIKSGKVPPEIPKKNFKK